ncbi:MAG TPA: HAD family hydrolase [Candidatus Binatia bacterium]|nr:HAD family hydrolase [Candidatus Binatia bacterium]
MSTLPTIVLFDVDGTLVTTPGCGRRALERAFAARYGRSAVLRDVRLDGMTDRGIARAGLAALGVPSAGAAAETAIDALLATYVPFLEEEVGQTTDLQLHRGVEPLLDTLAGDDGIAVGLGTGNIRAGARAKLHPLGAFERFPFGGFGCDHEDRTELLRIGAARGAARLGLPLASCRVVVVGDTPRDVAAARAIGAVAIGVASCRFSASELLASGAARAFEDLADAGVLPAITAAVELVP